MEYTRRFAEYKINEKDEKVKISIFIAKFFGQEFEIFINNKKFSLSQIYDQDPNYVKLVNKKIHNKIWNCIEVAQRLA